MEIRLLKHAEIDKVRWKESVLKSYNGLMYAWPVFLDAMSPGWQALVVDDYQIIMPLTVQKKWGIRYLAQPKFCQQLGVFAQEHLDELVIKEFIEATKNHVRYAEINLNFANSYQADDLFYRKNYVLSLSVDYKTMKSNYRHDVVRKDLARTQKMQLRYEACTDFSLCIQTYQEYYASRTPHVTKDDYDNLLKLCKQLQTADNAFARTVRLPNKDLLACDIFLKDQNRIYYLMSSTLPNGRTLGANHFLMNNLIQEFAGSGLLLDFEGSDIPGVERFCQKWGAINQPYFFCKWNNLQWPAKIFKK